MVYNLVKKFFRIKSPRIKLLILAFSHILRVRYIGIFLDPVIACNLRCKMCHFSDDEKRPKPQAPMSSEYQETVAKAVFSRAAKLQIGCAAEPTLYNHLPELLRLAKRHKVPYIEMTSNGQLLSYETLSTLVNSGLDGITLSLHGTTRETYEYLMGNADFDRLISLIDALKRIKTEHPKFSLRINYTFNNLNVAEMHQIFTLFDGVGINVIQIRPIQNLGDTEYSDFDLSKIIDDYDNLILPIETECKARGITYLGPSRQNLAEVNKTHSFYDEIIEQLLVCYISPSFCYHDDFNPATDTFNSYHRRRHLLRTLLKAAFTLRPQNRPLAISTKTMNYTIK